MPDFITLTCPSCGRTLQLASDIDRIDCVACGNEYMVIHNGGIVALQPVLDCMKRVQIGVDKIASELKIERITKEIEEMEKIKIKIPSLVDIDIVPESESTGCDFHLLMIVGLIMLIVSAVNSWVAWIWIGITICGSSALLYAIRRSKKDNDDRY
jgi:hypothetical protein